MRKILFILLIASCFLQEAMAQNATFSVPVSIGRNNCGSGSNDSVYYFNYTSPNLVNGPGYTGCKPVLKVNYAPLTSYSTGNKPFTVFNASVAFNPKDQMLYYVWTDYNVAAPYKSYIWRWSPTSCPTAAGGLDTVRTFATDIGGLTFDANGIAYQLEFNATAPYKAFLRTVDFTTGVIGVRDTLDLTGGKQLWNVGSGDITLTPSGQMYFVFNNKLFTPDYGSYNGPTHHIKCTYIDTVRAPAGVTALPGLAFGNGDLIAAYSPGCVYKRINGVTGDTASVNYTYTGGLGVRSTDMTQINSGLGVSKKLVSVTPTAFANQYDVVYDVYVRNYGNVPITNVQVSDNLSLINGLANVSNVTASLTSNPAGVALSGLYNGTTVTNLLAASQTLPCYPVANNNFTIRISCTLSNILSGVVYNNQAIGTANGYKNVALRDSSTNGSNPDLNQNDKPDDVGESEPTPFVIILTPTTPPCSVLAQTLYKNDFSTGTGLVSTVSITGVTASSAYTGVTTAPVPVNRFTVSNNANNGNTTDWISLLDHTGNTNGRMLLVNADAPASVMYRDTLPVGCPNQQYSVSLWAAFIGNSTYQVVCDGLGGFKYPKLTMRIRDRITGLTITQFTTDDITATSWQQLGMKWIMPSGYTNVILEIINAGPGGCGNDIAIDDITYGICDPLPTVSLDNPSGSCLGSSVTFTANVTDPAVVPGTKDYQWQWSPSPGSGPWTNIVGATAATYTINPITITDTGRYYRVIVAAQGNISNTLCQYISPGVKLIGFKPSTAPSSISAPSTTLCSPGSVTLTAVGGVLGTGANYQWGTGSVIGSNPIAGATAATYNVSGLTTTTTYWVRIENTISPCLSTTAGTTLTVTINQPSVAPASISGADFCNPGSTVLTAVGGTLGTGANYQWGTGAVVGTNPIAGATNPTLTVSPTSTTTYWVRIQNTTSPCTATTGGVTKVVTVMQPSTGPSSISAPSSTFCNTGTVTLTAVGGILGTGANYQWGTGSVIGTNPIAGATGATYNVSGLTTTTTYWVRIENTTSPCSATTGGALTTITINTASVAPTSITGNGFCNPGSTVLTATGGTLGTGANYQWGTGGTIGTNPIAGATGPTLTVSPTTSTTYWVRIENTTAPCTATTSGVTRVLTVTQPSSAPTSISAPSTTFCNSATTGLTAVGGTLGTGANYQWGTGSVIGVNPIAGATGPTYSVVGLTSTTTYWVRIENTASPCTAITGGALTTITINTSSVAPSSITGADFCNPGSTILTANGGTLGTNANYQWGTGSVVGTNPIAGATGSTLTVSPTSSTTYWVRIENTAGPCTANTGGVTKLVTVTQPSSAPTAITAPSSTFCNTGTVTLTATGGTLGTGANYQWGTGAVVGVNPIAGATSATYNVTGLTTTTTYWVRIENTASPCTAITGGTTTTITINTSSIAPTSITGNGFCNPGSTLLTANGGTLGTNANYQWGTGSVVGTNPIAGATGATLTVSPASTTTYWVRIENTSSPCTANTGGVTRVITVTQPSVAPASITASAPSICNSGSSTLTAVGGTLGTGANYQWGTGSVVGVNPIAGATGISYTATGITSTSTYWVRIENTSSPCTAITGGTTVTVTVNTSSVAPSSITGADFCNPGSVTLTANGGTLGSGANYQWGTGSVIGTNPIAGATGSTLTASPTSTTTYWVRIENTAGPCAANTGGVTKLITVKQPSVAATAATKNKGSICPGISVVLGITGGSLGTGASWKWYSGSCTGTAIGTGASITVTPSVNTTYYVRAEGDCNTTACVSVTVTISCDIDKDKDGIPDWVESNMPAAFLGSPIVNAYNPAYPGFVDNNSDYINDNFQADGDSDNDGTPNYLDTDFPGRIDSNGDGVDDRFDTDLDGRINMLDLDSDNDGIPDVVEAYGVDANGDGIIDNWTDTDNDGLSQNVDANNTGAANTGQGLGKVDLDGDGYPNFLDVDSDNDGIPDLVEAGGADTNNDGRVDVFVDANNDGWSDNYVGMVNALLRTGPDGNNDGRADNYPYKNMDADAKPNPYDRDSDGDGLTDLTEANLPDDNLDGIVDGTIGTNGWSVLVSAKAALGLPNTDGDNNYDYLDIDSDDDGITDNIEGQTTAGHKIPTTADADGDGLATVYDQSPSAFGGGGIFPVDTDLDGVPDYLDNDSDADGQIDRIEGNDFNFNKMPDDIVTLTGVDTDGDGLDDRFDNDNTSAKVTSAYMGNLGVFTGPTPPGTRSVVQRSFITQSDRDWRYVGNVLPVQLLKFSGVPQNNKVQLNWTIIADKEVDHFEIERSMDNSNYVKTGTVRDAVALHVQQSFGYLDDISSLNNEVIYYKLKVVGKAGDVKYSNILVIRRTQLKTAVSIVPNPANNYVSIRFFADKDGEATIRLIDNIGKVAMLQQQKVYRGNNTIQVNGLAKFSNGIYTVQVMINNEVVSEKLVLAK